MSVNEFKIGKEKKQPKKQTNADLVLLLHSFKEPLFIHHYFVED